MTHRHWRATGEEDVEQNGEYYQENDEQQYNKTGEIRKLSLNRMREREREKN